MTTKKQSATKKPITIDITDPDSTRGTQKALGGSQSDYWNIILLNQAANTLWTGHSDEDGRDRQCKLRLPRLLG
jgi:hypothetical protein